jgi:hypothetical protein
MSSRGGSKADVAAIWQPHWPVKEQRETQVSLRNLSSFERPEIASSSHSSQ